jgi:hypothetical protein
MATYWTQWVVILLWLNLTKEQKDKNRTGPVPLNSFPQFISGFSALLKLPLMLVAGF